MDHTNNQHSLIHGELAGGNEPPEYMTWRTMKQRCYNPKNAKYKLYGAKGIKVCDRWHTYTNFLEDMGRKPGPEYTIGRINGDGDYDLLNCRWETITQQNRNRKSVKLTIVKAREIRMLRGRGYTYKELAKEFEVSIGAIRQVTDGRCWKEELC